MKKIVQVITGLLFLITAIPVYAQQEVEMADAMRANGKIYVLVAIVLVVLVGLLVYLITIDRKVSRMEKRITETKH